jgi:hypothetical protein
MGMPSEFPEQSVAPKTDIPPVIPDASFSIAGPSVRSRWTGKAISWSLLVIALGGWFMAWLVHRGVHMPFVIEDFGTRTFIVASAVFLLLLLVKIPEWQVANLSGTDRDRFSAENEARRTFAQVVGGIGLVAGLYFTSLQVRSTQDTATKNEALTRDGQITDRYIKAVQQLGTSDPANLPVRIGAIFALERIARESRLDHWPIMELLTAFVRHRSPSAVPADIQRFKDAQIVRLSRQMRYVRDLRAGVVGLGVSEEFHQRWGRVGDRWWNNALTTQDVQAAMTVLGRRTLEYESEETPRLNLRETNLRGLNLAHAHLEGADLISANLSSANLTNSCLCGADLRSTVQDGTDLRGADLRNADLANAVLLPYTRMQSSDLRQANLQYLLFPVDGEGMNPLTKFFDGADLQGASIGPAEFEMSREFFRRAGTVVLIDATPLRERPFIQARGSSDCVLRRWAR